MWGISREVWFSTLVPTFVTIFVFCLGYLFNRWYESRKRKRELEEIKEYYLSLIDMQLQAVEKQADEFILYSRFLKYPFGKFLVLRKISAFNFDNIRSVSHFDLFNIFIKGKTKSEIGTRTPQFNLLHVRLKMLESISDNFEEKHNKFGESIQEYQKIWIQQVNALREDFDSEISHMLANNLNVDNDPFFQGVVKLQKALIEKANSRDRPVVIEMYILPLKKLCVFHGGDPRATKFLRHTMNCISTHEQLDLLYRHFRRDLLVHARRMVHARIDIRKAIDVLK